MEMDSNGKKSIIVGIFGSMGAIFRYLIYLSMEYLWNPPIILETFLVNIIGVYFLAVIAEVHINSNLHYRKYKKEILTGFFGAFTTFSTFIAEEHMLFSQQQYWLMLTYLFLSIGGGFLMIFLANKTTNLDYFEKYKGYKEIE